MQVLDFSTEIQKAEVSVILLKSDPTTGALPAILKILQTNKRNTCSEVSFRCSYMWVDWTPGVFQKESSYRRFFDNFPKLS